MQKTIGRRIAQLRLAKGMTQERLAREVGVSSQAVSKWENDANYPDITLLSPLARLLGTTVDELLGGTEPGPSQGAIESAPAARAAQEPAQAPEQDACPPPSPNNAAWVHIQVTGGAEGDDVDVSIPLSVVRFAVGVALAQPAIANNAALEGFDPDAILRAIEGGELGTIVDVADRDGGSRVRIWVG